MSVLNLPCSSCSGQLRNVYDIYGTNCGHLFHGRCLSLAQSRNPSRRCPKCRFYTPVMYKLFGPPEEIDNINALEVKLQTITKSKDQLEKDLEVKSKKFLDLQTATEEEVSKLKADVQLNADREHQLHIQYSNRISNLKEQFAKQKLQLENDVKVKKKQLSELEVSAAKSIAAQKSQNKGIVVISKAIELDYEQRIINLKANLADFTKQKEQLEIELHAKQRQLEESATAIDKFKSLTQASDNKASRLLMDGKGTSDPKDGFAQEKKQLKLELILKNQQVIQVQTDFAKEISKLKADIQSKEHKETQLNKELSCLRNMVKTKSKQIAQLESKYNNDIKPLKAQLQAHIDNSKKQQVEMEKLLKTIQSFQKQKAQQSDNSVVPTSSNNRKMYDNEILQGTQLSTRVIGSSADEITQLKEQLKTLEQKLQFMSGELDKQILKSTQLEVKNLTLQSYVDCMKNDSPQQQ